jgi:hypothetical protein
MIQMAKLVVSIPDIYFNEDLIGIELIDIVPAIEDDGQILLGEIILRLKDGRMAAIVPVMRGMVPWLKLKILDVQD